MDFALLAQGIVIGFSIAAPVGPIGVLCIRRTLAEGRVSGLLSGLGAATADLCYGCIAAFGLSWVGQAILDYQHILRLVGGAFLIYLGLRTFLAPPSAIAWHADSAARPTRNLPMAYGSTFLLTLTNPVTILSFAGIFAGAGLAGTSYTSAVWMVVGVFFGSAAWWLLLSGGVGLFRDRITPDMLRWINRLSGVIITLFGARFIWQAIGELIR